MSSQTRSTPSRGCTATGTTCTPSSSNSDSGADTTSIHATRAPRKVSFRPGYSLENESWFRDDILCQPQDYLDLYIGHMARSMGKGVHSIESPEGRCAVKHGIDMKKARGESRLHDLHNSSGSYQLSISLIFSGSPSIRARHHGPSS